MATLAIVSYPTLNDSDQRWIESCRASHDPQASRIAAHFTLVFPLDVEAEPLREHASVILQRTSAISFVLRRAESIPDRITGGGHVFLVPEEGRGDIVELHDRLYGGLLRPYLRQDMPFLPHITVGAFGELARCQGLAAELNRVDLRIRGRMQAVDIIEVRTEGVSLVSRVVLEKERRPTTGCS